MSIIEYIHNHGTTQLGGHGGFIITPNNSRRTLALGRRFQTVQRKNYKKLWKEGLG